MGRSEPIHDDPVTIVNSTGSRPEVTSGPTRSASDRSQHGRSSWQRHWWLSFWSRSSCWCWFVGVAGRNGSGLNRPDLSARYRWLRCARSTSCPRDRREPHSTVDTRRLKAEAAPCRCLRNSNGWSRRPSARRRRAQGGSPICLFARRHAVRFEWSKGNSAVLSRQRSTQWTAGCRTESERMSRA
jgi:hypothetical protein